MNVKGLDWNDYPEGWMAEVATFCSERGGAAYFMFGAEGRYYKVSWYYYGTPPTTDKRTGIATGKDKWDTMRLVSERLFGVHTVAD